MNNELIQKIKSSKKIVDLVDSEKSQVADIIELTFLRINQRPKDVIFITEDLINQVKKRFNKITLFELHYVLEKGILGDYGEYFNLSVVQFVKWIEMYVKLEGFEVHKNQNLAIAEKSTITDSEKNKMCLDYCKQIWKDYKQNRVYDKDLHAVVFDTLYKNKKISINQQTAQIYFEQAKKTLEKINPNDKTKYTKKMVIVGTSLVEMVVKETAEKKCQILAKRLFIRDYFENLIREKKELF